MCSVGLIMGSRVRACAHGLIGQLLRGALRFEAENRGAAGAMLGFARDFMEGCLRGSHVMHGCGIM